MEPCIINGFRKCGLFPLDPNNVDYTKCVKNELERKRHDVEPVEKISYEDTEAAKKVIKTLERKLKNSGIDTDIIYKAINNLSFDASNCGGVRQEKKIHVISNITINKQDTIPDNLNNTFPLEIGTLVPMESLNIIPIDEIDVIALDNVPINELFEEPRQPGIQNVDKHVCENKENINFDEKVVEKKDKFKDKNENMDLDNQNEEDNAEEMDENKIYSKNGKKEQSEKENTTKTETTEVGYKIEEENQIFVKKNTDQVIEIEDNTTEKNESINDKSEQAIQNEGRVDKTEMTREIKNMEINKENNSTIKVETFYKKKSEVKSPLKTVQIEAESNHSPPKWPEENSPIKTVEVEEVLTPFSRHLRFPEPIKKGSENKKKRNCQVLSRPTLGENILKSKRKED
ncbi:U2 snRNP-associated SURP motif-containing protein-like [Photinus pyralis]|nr:U2 snRNP-associated SURP motif-containing protein-like [Photinus pyralis]XP_031329413.1 U2 snRNP-associated SURP motif-containing protein-like [Photinus pyralis]